MDKGTGPSPSPDRARGVAMSSPLADYYRPLSAAPDDEAGNRPPSIEDRPASAQGSAGIKSNVPRRPKSVPPGGATGRLLREIQKSRSAVYSLDVDDEPLPPGRDPTLLGKHPDDDGGTTCQQPRWVRDFELLDVSISVTIWRLHVCVDGGHHSRLNACA